LYGGVEEKEELVILGSEIAREEFVELSEGETGFVVLVERG